MRCFFWSVLFPLIPLVLGFFTALGCDLAGVGDNGWWELVAGLTLAAYAAACWIGTGKAMRCL